jgi:hypothetical protein
VNELKIVTTKPPSSFYLGDSRMKFASVLNRAKFRIARAFK